MGMLNAEITFKVAGINVKVGAVQWRAETQFTHDSHPLFFNPTITHIGMPIRHTFKRFPFFNPFPISENFAFLGLPKFPRGLRNHGILGELQHEFGMYMGRHLNYS
nr:MAG TPA: hypothetical protein [Caudoviricetes sp.]